MKTNQLEPGPELELVSAMDELAAEVLRLIDSDLLDTRSNASDKLIIYIERRMDTQELAVDKFRDLMDVDF